MGSTTSYSSFSTAPSLTRSTCTINIVLPWITKSGRACEALDASLLLMPVVEFVGPSDPRWLATLDRVQKELTYDVLVERYEGESANDGPADDQGAFGVCSFWLVECLTRAGRLDEARLILEKMFSYANHLGLYAEKIGYSGEALGNFPHAFTHLSLITAVVRLDRALG